MIMEIELQSQVLDAINYVLYDQLKFKGNRMDYYNALNLYMHQVRAAAPPTPTPQLWALQHPLCAPRTSTIRCLSLQGCAHTGFRHCWGKGGCVGSVPLLSAFADFGAPGFFVPGSFVGRQE